MGLNKSVNLEHVGLFELVNVRVALLHLVKVNGGAVEETNLIKYTLCKAKKLTLTPRCDWPA